MRISDWSSDGCSSDLAAILRDYPRDGTWYLGFMIVDAAQRGRGVGRSIYSTVESWAAARGATEIRLAVLEELTLYAFSSENWKRPESEVRSEEHTSELLSLMRNSYTVFCLKKKKH